MCFAGLFDNPLHYISHVADRETTFHWLSFCWWCWMLFSGSLTRFHYIELLTIKVLFAGLRPPDYTDSMTIKKTHNHRIVTLKGCLERWTYRLVTHHYPVVWPLYNNWVEDAHKTSPQTENLPPDTSVVAPQGTVHNLTHIQKPCRLQEQQRKPSELRGKHSHLHFLKKNNQLLKKPESATADFRRRRGTTLQADVILDHSTKWLPNSK